MSLKSLSVNWGYSSPPESIFIVVLDGLFKLVVTFVKAWWKSSHSFTQVGQWLPWLFIHWYWPLQQPPFIQAKQEGNVCEFRAQFNRPSPVSSVSNLTVTHLSVSPSVSVSVPSSLLLSGLLWLVGTHSLSVCLSLCLPLSTPSPYWHALCAGLLSLCECLSLCTPSPSWFAMFAGLSLSGHPDTIYSAYLVDMVLKFFFFPAGLLQISILPCWCSSCCRYCAL